MGLVLEDTLGRTQVGHFQVFFVYLLVLMVLSAWVGTCGGGVQERWANKVIVVLSRRKAIASAVEASRERWNDGASSVVAPADAEIPRFSHSVGGS